MDSSSDDCDEVAEKAMDSSSDDMAEKEMNQSISTPLVTNGNNLYRQRFNEKKRVVEMLEASSKNNGEFEVYLGSSKKSNVKNVKKGERKIKGTATRMSEDKVLTYPLGAINLIAEAELRRQAELEKNEMKETKGKAGGGGILPRKIHHNIKQRGPKASPSMESSDDDFIVSDSEIDPPSRRKVKKNMQKRKKEKSAELTSDNEEDEEESPRKKKGRKNVEEVVPMKRGRGRPPKNRPVELPSKRKETPPKKVEMKTKTEQRKKSKRIEESEDDDDILVLSPPKTGKRQVGKPRVEEKKKNQTRKKQIDPSSEEIEEEDEEPQKTQTRGRSAGKSERRMIEEKRRKVQSYSESEEVSEKRTSKRDETQKRGTRTPNVINGTLRFSSPFRTQREKEDEKREERKKKMQTKRRNSDESVEDARKKRKKKEETEESEDSEEEEGTSWRENEEERSEMPSTSSRDTRHSNKTAHDLYLEKKKKKLKNRKSTRQSNQKKNVAHEAKRKKKELDGDDTASRGGRGSSVGSNASRDGGVETFFFISRSRSASRERGVTPSVGGSRCGSVAGSRAGSPERDDDRERSIQENDTFNQRLEEKLKNREIIEQLKQEDKEKREKERLKKEKEREQATKQKERERGKPTSPINPAEKIRAKPRVAMRSSRDPGILDEPSTLHSTIRSVPLKTTRGGSTSAMGGRGGGRGGTAGRPTGSRPVTPSLDPLDAIQMEMDQPLPSAPTIGAAAQPHYVNPTQVRMYAPDNQGEREKVARRIEYGGSNEIAEPFPIHLSDDPSPVPPPRPPPRPPSSSRRPITPVVPLETSQPLTDLSRSTSKERSGAVGTSSIPSTSHPLTPVNGGEGEEGREDREDREDPFDDYPASPTMDAPASPDQSRNAGNAGISESAQNNVISLSDDDDEVSVLPFRVPINLESMTETERETFNENTTKAQVILGGIVGHLLEGETVEILWALNWMFEKQHRCYFDDPSNREFIYQLINSPTHPSPVLLSSVHLLIKWDSSNCDWDARLDQSRIDDRFLHPKSSLTFAVIPKFIENERGEILYKKTPLSDAVWANKFEWIHFLIQEGAHVNDSVVYREFRDHIIVLAIAKIPKDDMQFNMLRLLLSYGANRSSARYTLESMKRETIHQGANGVNELNFDTKVPFYRPMHQLLSLACRSISDIFVSDLRMMPQLRHDWEVQWVRETSSSLPYKTFLVIQFEDYFKTSLRDKTQPIFAVIAGISKYNVMQRNADPEMYKNVQVGRSEMELMHDSRGDPPFSLLPCAKIRSDEAEPLWNFIKFESLCDDRSVFIIPPQLYRHLKAFMIVVHENVNHHRIVFGGLAKLNIKSTEMQKRPNVEEALKKLRGARGEQYGEYFACD